MQIGKLKMGEEYAIVDGFRYPLWSHHRSNTDCQKIGTLVRGGGELKHAAMAGRAHRLVKFVPESIGQGYSATMSSGLTTKVKFARGKMHVCRNGEMVWLPACVAGRNIIKTWFERNEDIEYTNLLEKRREELANERREAAELAVGTCSNAIELLGLSEWQIEDLRGGGRVSISITPEKLLELEERLSQ